MFNHQRVQGVLPKTTLFIHGNLASNLWWQPSLEVIQSQAGEGQKGDFIAAEWWGCGQSPHAEREEQLNPWEMAKEYLKLMDTLQLSEPIHVVGHSTGGIIALCALSLAPERFDRAVLLDPVSLQGVDLDPEILVAFETMSSNKDLCAQVLQTTIEGVQLDDPLFQQIVSDAAGVGKVNWKGVPQQLDNFDMRAEAANINNPVLILHGEKDVTLPAKGSQQMAEILPQGEFELIPGQGHSFNIENPQAFVDRMASYLFAES
jgi:pimeloyl-ACP methyl ester carboxylesterase